MPSLTILHDGNNAENGVVCLIFPVLNAINPKNTILRLFDSGISIVFPRGKTWNPLCSFEINPSDALKDWYMVSACGEEPHRFSYLPSAYVPESTTATILYTIFDWRSCRLRINEKSSQAFSLCLEIRKAYSYDLCPLERKRARFVFAANYSGKGRQLENENLSSIRIR